MKRRAAAAALVVVAAAAVAAVAGAFLWQRAVRTLPRAAGRALGRAAAFDGVRLGFWRGPAVTVVGARLAEHPKFGAGRPFLTADAITMRLDLGRLLRGRVTVDGVAVERPVLRIARSADGALNLARLGRARGRREPAPAGRAAPTVRPRRRRGRFRLDTLTVRHGVVAFHDAPSGRVVTLTDVEADAEAPQFDVPIPLVLRARLDDEGLRADAIGTRGRLTLAGPQSVYDGTLAAGPGTVGALRWTRLESPVHAEPRALVLDPATLHLPAGELHASLRLDGGAATPLHATLGGRDLDVARLTARSDDADPPAAGTLALDVDLTGPVGGPHFLDRVTGTLSASVADGRLAAFALGHALRDVLAPVSAGERGRRLRRRYPDLFSDDGVRFTRGSASGRIGGGAFRTDDLRVEAASWHARGRGIVRLDGRLDLRIRVTTSPELADALLGRSRARAILVDKRGALTVPLRVRGRLGRPRVVVDPAFAPTLARAAVAHAGYARHPFGDTMSSVLERVLGARSRRR